LPNISLKTRDNIDAMRKPVDISSFDKERLFKSATSSPKSKALVTIFGSKFRIIFANAKVVICFFLPSSGLFSVVMNVMVLVIGLKVAVPLKVSNKMSSSKVDM